LVANLNVAGQSETKKLKFFLMAQPESLSEYPALHHQLFAPRLLLGVLALLV